MLSTFALVFAAEWGDKSFIATIALAAASSPVGVVAGAVAGHGVATALAVAGGNAMGKVRRGEGWKKGRSSQRGCGTRLWEHIVGVRRNRIACLTLHSTPNPAISCPAVRL